ncbi:MAG: hypothetical protein HGA80_00430 [Candidatus Omnitrophica bacterium]|nr:hypothetical protein [Candidatus Omnitrophota bacterium]
MKLRVFLFSFIVCLLLCMSFPASSLANNLSISNVQMGVRDVQAKTLAVFFDVSWDNSWKNKINHDAIWLTVRMSDVQSGAVEKRLCQMSVAGVDPTGTGYGTNSYLELFVPGDKIGTFLRRKANAPVGTMSSKNVMVTVDYSSCGFDANSQIGINVFGMEMVLVPEGDFYAGDFASSNAAFRQGSSDNAPWHITSEGAINVSSVSSGGHYYSSASNVGEFASGATFTIPAAYPKGFNAFYAAKYEITEGQWVEFINSLPVTARTQHDLTDPSHKNSDAVLARNTVACVGDPLVCTSQRPARALSYLSWKGLCAFLDWAGLRPMTELEFEKLARGPYMPLSGEFAWGGTDIVAAGALSGVSEEAADETVTTVSANARYGGTVLSGGDAGLGAEYQSGSLRSGMFATSISKREQSGAGSYAAMELSGNVSEEVVTVGNSDGLLFTGQMGDGYLSTAVGFTGNANVIGWPGMDIDVSKGVTGSAGSGLRGGSWSDNADRLRISDRMQAAYSVADATASVGGRGVRSCE